jgi:hypothetical protein
MNVTLTDAQHRLLERTRAFRRDVIEPAQPHVREWLADPAARFSWLIDTGSTVLPPFL